MIVFKKPKRTWEEAYFGFDFKTYPLDPGVTVSSATFLLTVAEGTDADPNAMKSGAALTSGTRVRQKLIAGVSNTRYILHGRAVMSDGQKLEECGTFWVLDCDDE
jgi:hypothetical protein